jgi:AbrB family looped-hinge helix DNA binding protein
MVTARVSKKGQLVVPAEIRKRYGIEEGKEVEFLDFGGEINLIPLPDDPIQAAEGWLRPKRSVGEMLGEVRAEEEKLEKEKFKPIGGKR